ncbi:MAG: hypothetical protein QM704_10510 [Anaeromyxobacteraceae bacterium]
MSGYAAALALTLAVEVPLVAALFPGRRLRMAALAAVATTATHLFMGFGLPRLVAPGAWLLAGEAFATAAEAAAYALATRNLPRALVASGLANLASFLAGAWLLG